MEEIIEVDQLGIAQADLRSTRSVLAGAEREIARLEQELEGWRTGRVQHAQAAQLAEALVGAATALAATGQAMTYQARRLREQAALAARREGKG